MEIGDIGKPRLPQFTPADNTLLDSARRSAEKGDIKETARQFETLFGVLLVREMRRAMPEGMFGKGAGADVYEGWFDEKVGEALAQDEALGIASMIERSMALAHQTREVAGEDE